MDLLLDCCLVLPHQQEEQQYTLPPRASLALSWFQSGQADLETLLASTGVTGSHLLQAMASAHCRMARSCTDAHRKAPGLREAKTWAGAAGVLLQQGWCLSRALWQGWVQAYMRSYAVTEGLLSDGQGAFLALGEQLHMQAPAAASAHDSVLAVQAAGLDDMLVDGQDRGEQQQGQLVVRWPAAAGWPNQLLRPCQWPVWLGLQELANGSVAAAAARDASLPVWLLAQALAADAQVALGGAQHAARELLQQLPAAQRALLPVKLLCTAVPDSSSAQQQMLPQLAATATLLCLLQPPSVAGAAHIKQQLLQHQFATVAAAASMLQQHLGSSASLSSSQLVQLVQQLPAVLSEQPWQCHLQQLLPQLGQQQLLVSAMQLPQQLLGLLLPVMSQAVCHAAVEAAVAAAAAQANSTGDASPYQQSVWRAQHPQERARYEASHPAVDCLQPCLALVAEAEAAAVAALAGQLAQDNQTLPGGSSSGGEAEPWHQLLQAVGRLQMARSELWTNCHGSMQQQYCSGASSTAVATEVQPERLAWAWAQLSKRMAQLLSSSPRLLSAESGRRWVFLQQQMSAALQLGGGSAKPLLWRLGGHPQLPPTMRLLQAQRRVGAFAAALAVGGGAGFRVDGRGQPAALVAAGLDWRGLLQEAVAAARVQQEAQQQAVQQPVGPNGLTLFGDGAEDQQGQDAQAGAGAGIDFDVLLEGLEGGSAVGPEAELREQLAQAATAVLSCSPGFRHSVAQGLALLGFYPHMQLLQQQQGSSTGSCRAAAAVLATQQAHGLLAVADMLQEQAHALLLPVLTEMLLSPQRLQHEAAGAAAVTAALKQKLPAGSGVLLLPARAMVSATVRQMQVDLQPLVQLSTLQEQQQLSTTTLVWLLLATVTARMAAADPSAQPEPDGAALLQRLEGLESRLLQALPRVSQGSCQGSAAAVVPYMQLSWLVSSLLDHQQWPLPPLLLQQVLPGLLHEAWYSWQAGLWAGTAGAVDAVQARSGTGSSRALPMPLQVLSSPVSLHVAAQTVAALQVCCAVAADGTSKVPRLQQLSLAVQHLLQSRGTCSAADCHWSSLGVLLSQLLLVHSNSMRDADAPLLQELTQQLLAWSTNGHNLSAADAQQWLQQCAAILAGSSHAVLASSAQELLLPCAEAVLAHLAVPTSQQPLQPWYSQLARQGWASLLFGVSRLQLVLPPSGVDPAGKYGYKADAVVRWVREQLDPTVSVQHLQQQLPGGLDAAPALKQLLQDRQALSARLQALRSRCVPRPDPPQYHHLHQEVSAFSRGLADPARLLAVGRALLAAAESSTRSAPGAQAAAAAHEASSWDASAAAWSERMHAQFGLYLDILQPVLLAVLEIRHGLCLLAAGSRAAQQAAAVDMQAAAPSAAGASSGHSSQQLVSITAGLLSFPPPLAPPTALPGHKPSGSGSWASSSGLSATPASMLALPQTQQLTGALVHQQQQALQGPGRSVTAAGASGDLAAFSWQLQCAHAALLVSVRELLAAGPAAAAAAAEAGSSGSGGGGCLGRVYGLMQQLVAAWQSVKEFEAQAAAEAAQLFKHKTQSKTFLTEEVRWLCRQQGGRAAVQGCLKCVRVCVGMCLVSCAARDELYFLPDPR